MADARNCTEVTSECPVEATLYGYRPNLAVNGALAVIFAICLLAQLGSICCFRVRTWSYMVPLALGTFIEVLGYLGRLMMNNNPWSSGGVSIQLICLIVAPSFVAAAVSVTFKHIIVYCGEQHSMMKPRFVPWLMIGTDFMGIIIQFLGAGILAMAVTDEEPDQDRVELGDNIIIFGVAFQVLIMIICGGFMVIYWRRFRRAKALGGDEYEMQLTSGYERRRRLGTPATLKFRQFCWAIAFSFATIFVRCIYRLIEMASGWGSAVQRDEPSFLVCDGLMIALAVIALTVFQPGFFFEPMMRKTKTMATSYENL